MTDRITLHEDDVETVARLMWDVEEVSMDRRQPFPCRDEDGMEALCFDDMTAEDVANWLRWARAACAGAPAYVCGVGVPAWTAARGMARVLAERRKASEQSASEPCAVPRLTLRQQLGDRRDWDGLDALEEEDER